MLLYYLRPDEWKENLIVDVYFPHHL